MSPLTMQDYEDAERCFTTERIKERLTEDRAVLHFLERHVEPDQLSIYELKCKVLRQNIEYWETILAYRNE